MPKAKRKPANRKGGGQPGNKNALKHGFYADLYTVKEAKNLTDRDIESEIAAFRIISHRLFQIAPLKKSLDEFTTMDIALLNILNLYGISINTFERTLLLAKGKGGEFGQTIWDQLMGRNPNNDKE